MDYVDGLTATQLGKAGRLWVPEALQVGGAALDTLRDHLLDAVADPDGPVRVRSLDQLAIIRDHVMSLASIVQAGLIDALQPNEQGLAATCRRQREELIILN